jgi:hypothetical protein
MSQKLCLGLDPKFQLGMEMLGPLSYSAIHEWETQYPLWPCIQPST